ncbi:uncharacterized protein LOC144158538 isoform X3 [Haemaphysalis longicornis]
MLDISEFEHTLYGPVSQVAARGRSCSCASPAKAPRDPKTLPLKQACSCFRKGDTATLTSSMPRVISSISDGCIMPVSMGAAHNRDTFCRSQKIQAAINTSATGTQCSLGFFKSASSQTAVEFPVLEVNTTLPGASTEFLSSKDNADIAAKTGLHTCSCYSSSGNKRSFFDASKEILCGHKLHSCLSCQRHTHTTTEVKVCASKMLHICTLCKKAFSKKHRLITHMGVHTGERPFVCKTCEKRYSRKEHLVRHERLHSGEKPYVCNLCQKSFTRKEQLLKHERLHSGCKPYMCSICQKSFTQRHHLIGHERLHSGERPYVCSICQKSFAQRSRLITHGRLHSGEKPYVCNICQKSFTIKEQLDKHERLHTGEKPYVCSICQESFTTRTHLNTHEKLHSGEKLNV